MDGEEGVAAGPGPATAAGEKRGHDRGSAAGGKARFASLIAYARRRGWRCISDGRRVVLIGPRTGAVIRLGVPPVAQ